MKARVEGKPERCLGCRSSILAIEDRGIGVWRVGGRILQIDAAFFMDFLGF